MIKNKLITINFIKGETTEKVELTDNFVFRLFEVWSNKTIGKETDIFIKVFLPNDYNEAMEILNTGYKFNDVEYVPFLTSPSMMKKEEDNYKCQYLFIKKKYEKFVNEFRKIVSLGNINKLYNEDKICINKDITSRLGLGLSGTYKIDYNPNVVILNSDTYTHIADYYTIKDGKLIEQDCVMKEFEFADGCGFMSDSMAQIIAENMKIDYTVDFAVIRAYSGLATKGLVVRCDFNKYFEENYQATEYFEKREDGCFYTKDYFGNWVNISKADLILNTNMCKYAKLFKDEEFEDINSFIDDKINKEFTKYKSVLQALYVTKINKREPKEYTHINYQVLNNLALVGDELKQIQEDSFNYIKSVSDLNDIDKIKIMLGDLVNEEAESAEINATTKAHRLLQIDEKNIKLGTVKSMIRSLIEKKAHEIVCSPFVKGNFKYISIDPICYLNWIMTRDIEQSRELKANELYVPKETGHRVMTRNPLATFSEVHKVELVKNEKLDKYFGHLTSELIFQNVADNLSFVSSGSDNDGDSFGIWDNEILYNAVIKPMNGRHFNYEADGKTVKVKYSLQEEYHSILVSSGNLIGKIANATMQVSNQAQELGYKNTETGAIHTFTRLKEVYLLGSEDKQRLDNLEFKIKEAKKIKDNKELVSQLKDERDLLIEKINTQVKAMIQKGLKQQKLIKVQDLPVEEQRQIITKQFYDRAGVSYDMLRLSQVAIDAPKTLTMPSKEEMDVYKEYFRMKKPRFMYFHKFTDDKDAEVVAWEDTIFTNSQLNISSLNIYQNLIKPIKQLSKGNDNSERIHKLIKDLELINNEECNKEVARAKKFYSKISNKITLAKKEGLLNQEEANKYHDKKDMKILTFVEDLYCKFTMNEIANALLVNNCTANIIIRYFWNVVDSAIRAKDREVFAYILDNNGGINFMFKNYKKVNASLKKDTLTSAQKLQLTNRLIKKVNVRITDENSINLSENDVVTIDNDLYVFNSEGVCIGQIYANSIKKGVELTGGKYTVYNAELKQKKTKYIVLEIY